MLMKSVQTSTLEKLKFVEQLKIFYTIKYGVKIDFL